MPKTKGNAPGPPTADGRKQLGRTGEDLAAADLERKGWRIIARNWRTRRGEIDIIARDEDWLVFLEVRTRRLDRDGSSPYLGRPEESVTPRKQLQLVQMAHAYLFEVPWSGRWRIDVIAIELDREGSLARFAHYRDAIGG